ncbi:MAG: S49 family peptidase [Saprospiraceae bacterium]|nr:S49 family peptidase [Saprospiraceae bacterium]
MAVVHIKSDIIWNEVDCSEKNIPGVASFGDCKASGGYYVACGADKIFAAPSNLGWINDCFPS